MQADAGDALLGPFRGAEPALAAGHPGLGDEPVRDELDDALERLLSGETPEAPADGVEGRADAAPGDAEASAGTEPQGDGGDADPPGDVDDRGDDPKPV